MTASFAINMFRHARHVTDKQTDRTRTVLALMRFTVASRGKPNDM